MNTKKLEFYFDFRSPFAYYMSCLLNELTHQSQVSSHSIDSINIEWIPISIDMLLNLQKGSDPESAYVDSLCKEKRQYQIQDAIRSAKFYKVPFTIPDILRPNSKLALQVALHLKKYFPNEDWFMKYATNVFQAMWVDNKNIESDRVIQDCLTFISKQQSDDILRSASSESSRSFLIEHTKQFFDKGIFGVPMVTVDNELFYGADRFEQIKWKVFC